jgi:GNAT superfamily N-acetyltransferase
LAGLGAVRHGLRVHWWHGWDAELDDALSSLPEPSSCPHELYRLLIQNPPTADKRTALVLRGGEPVAVAGVRRRAHDWVPVTHYLIPGIIFPHRPGYLGPVLAALGLDLAVGWWRMDAPPPDIPGIHGLERIPTFIAALRDDWESHWRTRHRMKDVRQARRKCEGFELRVNEPEDTEWTVRRCEQKWRADPRAPRADLEDRLVIARYLERIGRHVTLTLTDRGRPVSGATLVVQDNDLVAHSFYRSPEYDWHGVGNRLIDVTFQWGADHGFDALDLGGDHPEYKKYWAPERGAKYSFSVCPAVRYHLKRVWAGVSAVREKGLLASARVVRSRLSSLTRRPASPAEVG